MHITNDIFKDGFQYRLLAVQYHDVMNETTGEKTFNQIDKVERIETDERERFLEAYVSRTIRFSPAGPFEILVKFVVRREFSESVNMKDYSIDGLSDDEINEILAGTMSRASAVITSITGLFTNGPFVTPPIFSSEEE